MLGVGKQNLNQREEPKLWLNYHVSLIRNRSERIEEFVNLVPRLQPHLLNHKSAENSTNRSPKLSHLLSRRRKVSPCALFPLKCRTNARSWFLCPPCQPAHSSCSGEGKKRVAIRKLFFRCILGREVTKSNKGLVLIVCCWMKEEPHQTASL